MVSSISSRIKKAEAKARLPRHSHHRNKSKALTSNVRHSHHISGYAADSDQYNHSPDSSVCSIKKNLRAQTVEKNCKRRKTEELLYQAFHVKQDLEQASISYVPWTKGFLRTMDADSLLKVTNIPLKSIQFLTSKTYDDGYDTIIADNNIHDFHDEDQENDNDCNNLYSDLVYSCQHFYTSRHPIPTPSEEGYMDLRESRRFHYSEKSNSTLTSESGSSTPTPLQDSYNDASVLIHTAHVLEAVHPSCDDDDIKALEKHSMDGETKIKQMIQSILEQSLNSSHTMTLEETLSYNPANAILLLYKEENDFTIVHCNATFSHLTGIISDKVVGESICKVIKEIILPIPTTGTETSTTLVRIHKNRKDDVQSDSFALNIIPLVDMKNSSFIALEFQNLNYYHDKAYRRHSNQVVG